MGDFAGSVGGDEALDQLQAEVERRAGAAGGNDGPVHDHAFVGEDGGQRVRDREVGGVASTFEQPGAVQHGGRRADGGDGATGDGLSAQAFQHAFVIAQVFETGAAGHKDQIEGRLARQRVEGRVRVQREAAATGYMQARSMGRDRHLDAGAAQQVDRGDGFNLLKTLWQNGENGGHGRSLLPMSDDAPDFLRGQTVVIFGAGYVGSAVAHHARAAGARVVALTRNAERARDLTAAGVAAVVADLADEGWHERVPRDAAFVLNCVAAGGGGAAGYQRSYVDGLRSILRWGGPGALVYTGSTSVYPQDGGARVEETAPLADPASVAPTVAALREAEALVGGWAGAATVLRLAGIYGPGRHHLLDQLRATPPGEAAALAGQADHRLNLIHRDDIVAAVVAAWARPAAAAGEVFNVADDGAAPKGEVAAWLAARLGCPRPMFTGRAAAGRRAVTPDRIILNAKLKRVLGWRPRYPTFREGYAGLLGA